MESNWYFCQGESIGYKVSLACSAGIHMANIGIVCSFYRSISIICVVVQSLILPLCVINSVLISIPSGIVIHPTVFPQYRSPKNDL